MLFAKTPQDEDINAETKHTNRTLQLENQVVIVNKIIIKPVTLEKRHLRGRSNLNMTRVHLSIFIAMKKKNRILKLITENKTIGLEIQFPTGEYYTKFFTKLIKYSKSSRVYITHKI